MVMYAKSPYDFHHYFCLTSQFLTLCILNFFNFQSELRSGNLLRFAISDGGLSFVNGNLIWVLIHLIYCVPSQNR